MKEEKLKQEEKYMWAVVDGVKEKVYFILLFLSFYLNFQLLSLDSRFIYGHIVILAVFTLSLCN